MTYMTQINPGTPPTSTEAMPLNNESFLPQSTVLIVDDNPQNVGAAPGVSSNRCR
jgi:hypothetical protein